MKLVGHPIFELQRVHNPRGKSIESMSPSSVFIKDGNDPPFPMIVTGDLLGYPDNVVIPEARHHALPVR